MSTPVTVVHADRALLAEAAAARLVTSLVDAQAAKGHAHVVLTGGGAGIAVLAALAACPARDAVDWSALDVWWGDERFLPAGHPDRNATQAREALLGQVPVPAERVHEMAASDGEFGDDVDAAAAGYARDLKAHSRPEDHFPAPSFDVLMLGVGPDGHIASLFPEHPALHATTGDATRDQGQRDDRQRALTVIGVRGSPKPPPVRISLTMATIRHALDVWMVVAGADKAAAVALALGGAGELAIPAAGGRGRRQTIWLLDRAAAARIPAGVTRIASP